MATKEELQLLEELVALEEKRRGTDLASQVGSRAADVGRGGINAVEGLYNTMKKLPITTMPGLVSNLVAPAVGNTVGERVLPTPQGDSQARQYERKAWEGAGGALAVPGGGGLSTARNAAVTATSGAVGNTAAAAADEFLKDQHPIVRKIGSVLAGVLGGGATAYGLGPRKATTAEQDVTRDTGTLTGIGLNRVGPEVDAVQVANRTADAANSHIQDLERQNSNNFRSTVDGVQVRPRDVAQMRRDLLALADQEPRAGAADALREVADQLVHQNQRQYITSVPELSLALKNLKNSPPGPNAATGRVISEGDLASAIRTAEGMLGTVAPEFQAANAIYRQGKQLVIDPTKEGPVGRVADRNPNNPAPTPVGRLGNLVNDRAPGEIPTTVQQLQAQGASPQDIARALLQKSTEGGKLAPGVNAYGQPGSLQENRMDALVGTTGVDPNAVRAPFRAADTLAKTLPPGGNMGESVSIHPGGITARLSSFFGRGGEQAVAKGDYKRQIAELMANASPQEMEQLRQLSMFDPNIRMMMTQAAAMVPLLQNEGRK